MRTIRIVVAALLVCAAASACSVVPTGPAEETISVPKP